MGLGILTLLAGVAHAECPPLETTVEAATTALVSGADPGTALAGAEASLACGKVDRSVLARLWVVNGAAKLLFGDAPAAEPYFAAAASLSPGAFDDRLGPDARAAWEKAQAGAPGRLGALRPVDVDAVRIKHFPAEVSAGPHAIQALDAAWAEVIVVAPGETFELDVPAATPVLAKRKSAAWGVAGGVALAGAAAFGIGAYLEGQALPDAPSLRALDETWTKEQAFGGAALGLGVLGASGIVVQIALP